ARLLITIDKELTGEFAIFICQVNKSASLRQRGLANTDVCDQVEVAFDFVLVLSHPDRKVEYEAVAAQVAWPARTRDVTQSKRRTAGCHQQRQRPRMTVKLVDSQIVSGGADLPSAFYPCDRAGRIRKVINVVEESGARQHFFTPRIAPNLQVYDRVRITLPKQLQRRCIHYEVSKPVVCEHQYPIDSFGCKPHCGQARHIDIQQRFRRRSCHFFEQLERAVHSVQHRTWLILSLASD